jgi:DNA-damage-inducible protein D
MADTELTYFDRGGEAFERRSITNGSTWWLASDLMAMLGYESLPSFHGAINKAIGTCMTLGIPIQENFVQQPRTVDGVTIDDYKLSRFACYLTAMNGDTKKANVAKAQAYFAGLADVARQYVDSVNEVERVQVRDEITDRERSLNSTAKQSGVERFDFFQNAGYRGMYNMNLAELKRAPQR